MFDIKINKLYWINNVLDDPNDLCLHGDVEAIIGEERFTYCATVSATALYLLKTLKEDHIIGKENQMLPCCGFNMYANKALDTVDIVGCPNGIDWSVIHEGSNIKLVTESGISTILSIFEYEKVVFGFADEIKAFYQSCSSKILPEDEIDRNAYVAFWNEWHRRIAK